MGGASPSVHHPFPRQWLRCAPPLPNPSPDADRTHQTPIMTPHRSFPAFRKLAHQGEALLITALLPNMPTVGQGIHAGPSMHSLYLDPSSSQDLEKPVGGNHPKLLGVLEQLIPLPLLCCFSLATIGHTHEDTQRSSILALTKPLASCVLRPLRSTSGDPAGLCGPAEPGLHWERRGDGGQAGQKHSKNATRLVQPGGCMGSAGAPALLPAAQVTNKEGKTMLQTLFCKRGGASCNVGGLV